MGDDPAVGRDYRGTVPQVAPAARSDQFTWPIHADLSQGASGDETLARSSTDDEGITGFDADMARTEEYTNPGP